MKNCITTLSQNREIEAVRLSDEGAKIKGELRSSFEVEISALDIRRGTFVKARQTSVTHDELVAKRVKGKHNVLCSDMVRWQADIKVLLGEVRDSKRSLEDNRRSARVECEALEKHARELEADAKEWSRRFKTTQVRCLEGVAVCPSEKQDVIEDIRSRGFCFALRWFLIRPRERRLRWL